MARVAIKRFKRHEKLTEQLRETDIALAFLRLTISWNNASASR